MEYLSELIGALGKDDTLTIKGHSHCVVVRLEIRASGSEIAFQSKVNIYPDSEVEGAALDAYEALEQTLAEVWENYEAGGGEPTSPGDQSEQVEEPTPLESERNTNVETETPADAVGSYADRVHRPSE